ncbi:MAG: hypothetical protein Tsb0020_43320 [Haliangiales bacterium]
MIPQLIEAHGIPWGETRREWIVEIKAYDGVQALLRREVIETELQQRGLERLGIIVDANSEPDARWQALRNACIRQFPRLPEAVPEYGVVVANDERQTIGLWMMPGPRPGMLETYLAKFIPDQQGTLYDYAREVVATASQRGASFKPDHRDKAELYTWLAWQDPPGRQLHDALIQKILRPNAQLAEPFVSWFRQLYGV